MEIPADSPRVLPLMLAIAGGDVAGVRAALLADPPLASAFFVAGNGGKRTALHVVTDWPGHKPNTAAMIVALVEAGADPDAVYGGEHRETPLHWAASSDDVEAIDALIAAGADLHAPGGVLTGGPPLDDAVVFGQWNAARRLVELGAPTDLFHAAALGMTDRVAELLAAATYTHDELTGSLWHACNGGNPGTAALLLDAGGDPLWVGWNDQTPVAVAQESGNAELIELLRTRAAGDSSPAG